MPTHAVIALLQCNMIIMSIELSTNIGSIALLKDNMILAENSLTGPLAGTRFIATALSNLLEQTSTKSNNINMFATGLGPGSFSGLRSAISFTRAMALPDHKPVIGINSAEILADKIFSETSCDQLVVIGDARRNMLWLAAFDMPPPVPEVIIKLITPEELPDVLSKQYKEHMVATPEWDRIGEKLKQCVAPEKLIEKENLFPTASDAGRLAFKKYSDNYDPLPLTPIYMHPPVFVEPRF